MLLICILFVLFAFVCAVLLALPNLQSLVFVLLVVLGFATVGPAEGTMPPGNQQGPKTQIQIATLGGHAVMILGHARRQKWTSFAHAFSVEGIYSLG